MTTTTQRIYVPDAEAVWLPAELLEVDGQGHLSVKATRPRQDQDEDAAETERIDGLDVSKTPGVEGKVEALPLQNEDVTGAGTEDMCSLGYLHEAAVLYNLRRRYFRKLPYTYTGAMCIAINPYEWLAPLYQDEVRTAYIARPRNELPPHVYAVSAAAYRGVSEVDALGKWQGVDQSILVSGESGAGKTETVKIMMGHLASVSSTAVDDELDAAGDSVVARVLRSQPLLESFGNAKTVRNDNSSRFGKFTQLEFALEGAKVALVGSRCRTYLLEKSRVVNQAENERTYHCFYGLGALEPDRFAAESGASSSFETLNYIKASDLGTLTIEGVPDATRYAKVKDALSIVGVDASEQEALADLLTATLALGEVEFAVTDEADESSPSKVAEAEEGGDGHHHHHHPEAIRRAAALLGVQPAKKDDKATDGEEEPSELVLGRALTERTMRARGEVFRVQLKVPQAYDARDAFAKALYVRAFDWLVSRINKSTATESLARLKVVGLLDIFGFESFAVNRFEQLCINYTNEKLQQKFTMDLFKTVQLEYDDELVPWKHVAFPDNAVVLALIEGRMGVIDALNEECLRPKGTDENFVAKLKSLHGAAPDSKLVPHRMRKDQFTIMHYAGDVLYTAEKWLERNSDTLQEDLALVAKRSTKALVAGLFSAQVETSAKASRRGSLAADTVTTKFKAQLGTLIDEIERTSVQYVRCIKPNKLKSNQLYDAQMVVEQLRCAGVIEAVRVARAGYPNKLPHLDFVRKYACLAEAATTTTTTMTPSSSKDKNVSAAAVIARAVLGEPITDDNTAGQYAFGLTRVYFKASALEDLDRRRAKKLATFVIVIQAAYRRFSRKRAYVRKRAAATRAAAAARMAAKRLKYVRFLAAVVLLEAAQRRKDARRRVDTRRRDVAAVRIAARARLHSQRSRYAAQRAATTRLATWIRGRAAVAAYAAALAEAKEQAKLSNQLELMQKRMEAMKRDNADHMAAMQAKWQQASIVAPPSSSTASTVAHHPPPPPPSADQTSSSSAMNQEAMELLQQLKRENEKLRSQNNSLTAENAALKRKVTQLEAGQSIKSDWLAAARQQMAVGLAAPSQPNAGRTTKNARRGSANNSNNSNNTAGGSSSSSSSGDPFVSTPPPTRLKASRLGSVMATLGFATTPTEDETPRRASMEKGGRRMSNGGEPGGAAAKKGRAPHISLPLNRFWQDVPATSLSAAVPQAPAEVSLVHFKVGGQYLRATGTHHCCAPAAEGFSGANGGAPATDGSAASNSNNNSNSNAHRASSSLSASAASALGGAGTDGGAELCYLRCESPAVCDSSTVTSAHDAPASRDGDSKVRGYRAAMAFRVERVPDQASSSSSSAGGEISGSADGFSLIDYGVEAPAAAAVASSSSSSSQEEDRLSTTGRFRLKSELTGGYVCVGGLFQRYCLLANATAPADAAVFEFVARRRLDDEDAMADAMASFDDAEGNTAGDDDGGANSPAGAMSTRRGSDSMERLRARQLLVALRVVDGPKPGHFVRVRPDGYVNVAPPNAQAAQARSLPADDRTTPLLSVELLVPLHSYEITFHSSQLGLIVSKTMPLRVVRFKEAGQNFPAAEMTGRIGVGDVLATADGKDILNCSRREAVDFITSSRPITIGFRVASALLLQEPAATSKQNTTEDPPHHTAPQVDHSLIDFLS